MLTTSQRIENQGIQQGIQQGMRDKALAIAEHMLHILHMGIDAVQGATGLSRQTLEKLAQKS